MPDELFQNLSADDRGEALSVVAGQMERPAYLLEKDVWVVWTLSVLCSAPFGGSLTFKGGTSLSKAYNVIRRFSEDLDITYDIRAIAPDLIEKNDGNAIPQTRSRARRWADAINKRLSHWVDDQALPAMQKALNGASSGTSARTEGDKLLIAYEPLFPDYGFVKPEIQVEFGARATGEPRQKQSIFCDAQPYLPNLDFPSAKPNVMLAECTFWEKATAIHVFCRQARTSWHRLSRHWYDLVQLDRTEYGERALNRHDIALGVAQRKAMFYRANDHSGNVIDYEAAVSGGLQLVPNNCARTALSADYAQMADGGLLPADAESFDTLMDRCADIQARANR